MKKKSISKPLTKIFYLSPYLLILAEIGVYAFKTIDSDFLVGSRYKKLSESTVQEETLDVVIDEQPEIVVENLINQVVNEPEVIEEETTEEIVEEKTYGTELLESGYELKEIDFEGLREQNNEVCAWISMNDNNIDYPVLQHEDNEYYLKHDFFGKETRYGAIYEDSRVNSLESEELSEFTVIYGHKMRNNTMFGSLHNYKNQEYYDNNKFGVIYTPDGYAYKVDFFAGNVVDKEEIITRKENESFDEYIEKLKDGSTFESDVELEYGDKILVLCTCSYETNSSRYILYGKISEKQLINERQLEESNIKVK